MYLRYRLKTYLLIGSLMASLNGYAQLDSDKKKQTIISTFNLLKAKYVSSDILPELERTIWESYTKGKYDTISTGNEFAFQLTQDLQKITKDQHLKVLYSETNKMDGQRTTKRELSGDQWLKNLMIENNYGIKEKAILKGNIGYLSIPLFGPLRDCADTLIAAMNYVKDTKALIIDLRDCRGSLDENTIPFVFSYFFKNPVHIDNFYTRETNTTKQFWTYGYVPGSLYLDKPIYVLTSGKTFSGGEAFAYNLQQLKRGVIIGEVTRGGANPSEMQKISSNFSVTVPYAASISPISNTNWENVGVKPDKEVKSILALYEANLLALKELLFCAENQSSRGGLEEALLELKKPILMKVTFQLEGFDGAKEVAVAGTFNSFSRKSFLLTKVNEKWVGETEVEPGDLSYVFIVDNRIIKDPKNPKTVLTNGNENSYIFVK
ncbi:S41 family peptidase [Sphingobacterium sp. 18053]|uniref:S41 family peptidase n=1 Tax=Sphingobacterium sp. 18053 TaxID=2681401 RepID=UPI00135ACA77|nr:S41 family peptidase [Sphingobacterium sp. 18053]